MGNPVPLEDSSTARNNYGIMNIPTEMSGVTLLSPTIMSGNFSFSFVNVSGATIDISGQTIVGITINSGTANNFVSNSGIGNYLTVNSGTWSGGTITHANVQEGGEPYTWLITKSGSTYYAKNGVLGYIPTSGSNSSMDDLWSFVRTNFNLAGEQANLLSGGGGGGSIKFGRGVFTFTSGMIVDRTMASGARGINVEGTSKGGTILQFTPSSVLSGAIQVVGINEPVFRDLDLWVDDTSGKHCKNIIHINATSNACAGGLYDNIRIFKTTTSSNGFISFDPFSGIAPLSGQIGILIEQSGTNSTNTMHFAEFRKIRINETENAIKSVGIGNNSFMKFDGIYFWKCLRGFYGDREFKQSHLSNLIFQAASGGAYGEYVVQLAGSANTVSNITCDVLDHTSGAVVILQPESGQTTSVTHNRLWNLTNTGVAPHVLDLTGSDTNEGTERTSFTNTRDAAKIGTFDGVTQSGGTGLLQGLVVYVSGAATFSGTISTNVRLGKTVLMTTNSAVDSCVGIATPTAVTSRRYHPKLEVRFMNNGTTNRRFFIGFCATGFSGGGTMPGASDTVFIPTATECFGIGVGSGANYQVVRNDGTGDATISDFVTNDGSSNILVNSTTPNKLWIYLDDSLSRGYISLNDNNPNVFTTNLPAQDTPLYMVAFLENTQAAQTRGMFLGKMLLRAGA